MKLIDLFRKPKKHRTVEGKTSLILAHHDVDLFLDVGANVGQTGQMLRRWDYAGKIISFEPVISCYEQLVAAASNDPLWEVNERTALGDCDDMVEMMVSGASDLSSLSPPTDALKSALPRTETIQHDRVPIHRLDTLFPNGFKDASRPFLKIDAQGHDMAVLQGAEGIMDSIFGIQIEMSQLPLYEGEPNYLEILNYLHELGFVPHLMTERTFARRINRQLQIDGVLSVRFLIAEPGRQENKTLSQSFAQLEPKPGQRIKPPGPSR